MAEEKGNTSLYTSLYRVRSQIIFILVSSEVYKYFYNALLVSIKISECMAPYYAFLSNVYKAIFKISIMFFYLNGSWKQFYLAATSVSSALEVSADVWNRVVCILELLFIRCHFYRPTLELITHSEIDSIINFMCTV